MQMADWVKGGGALPLIPEMVAELTTPTYFFNDGKFQIESKDQVKKRLGRSPDHRGCTLPHIFSSRSAGAERGVLASEAAEEHAGLRSHGADGEGLG